MKIDMHRPRVRRRRPIERLRHQLAGGLLLAALLPYLLHFVVAHPGHLSAAATIRWDLAAEATFFATTFAICGGFYLVRSLSSFPVPKNAYFVFPSFALSYAVVAAVMLFARIVYSRGLLVASFALCISWFTIVYSALQKRQQLFLAVVPFGDANQLPAIPGVDWHRMRNVDDLPLQIDALVADFHADLPNEWERLLADCALRGTVVYQVKQLTEALTGRVQIDHLSENNFGSMVPLVAYLRFKMLADWLLALAMVVPVSLFLGAMCVVIRLGSPGSPIFTQQRMGYRGVPFTVFKLRTMRQSAASQDPRAQAITIDDDHRITPIGRFLRRARLDELPQIYNVLKLEMSWIGPRPEAVPLSLWYESELPFYRYRHVVRPGISGWAQINQGHVARINEVREKLQNDFYYIKYFSPWLDAIIVIRTVVTMLTGFGAR